MESIRWTAPEFAGIERSFLRSVGVVVFSIVLLAFALFQGNILFFIFILVAQSLLFFISKQPPSQHSYEFVAEGILADKHRLYRLSEIEKFSITDDGQSPYVELVLRHPKRFSQDVKLLLPRELADEVGALLGRFLKEFAYEETATEALFKRFGL